MTYRVIFDGSGTWLMVPEAEVEASGIKVTKRSRIKDGMVYLSDLNESLAFATYYQEETGYALNATVELDPKANVLSNEVEYPRYHGNR